MCQTTIEDSKEQCKETAEYLLYGLNTDTSHILYKSILLVFITFKLLKHGSLVTDG